MHKMIVVLTLVMAAMGGSAFAGDDKCCDPKACGVPSHCNCDDPQGAWCAVACDSCCHGKPVCPKPIKKATLDFVTESKEMDDKGKTKKSPPKESVGVPAEPVCPKGYTNYAGLCCPKGYVGYGGEYVPLR